MRRLSMLATAASAALLALLATATPGPAAATASTDPSVLPTYPCTADPNPDHPDCVAVQGRVVDLQGYPVPNMRVYAVFSYDQYPDGEEFPSAGEPMLNGSLEPAAQLANKWLWPGKGTGAVSVVNVFDHRDTTVTDANGHYELDGLYKGEVYIIQAMPVGTDPNTLGPYHQALLNLLTRYPFRTDQLINGISRAFAAPMTTLPDLQVVPKNTRLREIYPLRQPRWVWNRQYHEWAMNAQVAPVATSPRSEKLTLVALSHGVRYFWAREGFGGSAVGGDFEGTGFYSKKCGMIYSKRRAKFLPARFLTWKLTADSHTVTKTVRINTSACPT